MRERTPWQLLVSPNADRLPMRWSLLIQARLRTRSAPRPKADSLRSRASTPGGRRTARSTGIPHHPHPGRPELGLLYVGISPTRATSAGLIRSRVVDQHLGGNTASSTFRFVRAAFLFDKLSLTPRAKSKKVILDAEDNARLRRWQVEHLGLTWCQRARPWEVEDGVIALLQPPLHCAANESHPFNPRVIAVRAAFRAAARSDDASSV